MTAFARRYEVGREELGLKAHLLAFQVMQREEWVLMERLSLHCLPPELQARQPHEIPYFLEPNVLLNLMHN